MTITIDLYDVAFTDPLIIEADEGSTIAGAVNLGAGEVLVLADDVAQIDRHADPFALDRRATVGKAAKGHGRLTLLRKPGEKAAVQVHYTGPSDAACTCHPLASSESAGRGSYAVMCQDLRDNEFDVATTSAYEQPVAAARLRWHGPRTDQHLGREGRWRRWQRVRVVAGPVRERSPKQARP